MVDELLQIANGDEDRDTGVVYVYLAYIDRLEQTEENLIASLIK